MRHGNTPERRGRNRPRNSTAVGAAGSTSVGQLRAFDRGLLAPIDTHKRSPRPSGSPGIRASGTNRFNSRILQLLRNPSNRHSRTLPNHLPAKCGRRPGLRTSFRDPRLSQCFPAVAHSGTFLIARFKRRDRKGQRPRHTEERRQNPQSPHGLRSKACLRDRKGHFKLRCLPRRRYFTGRYPPRRWTRLQ